MIKIEYIKICEYDEYKLLYNKNSGIFEWTKDKKKFSKSYYTEQDAQHAYDSGAIAKELS